MMIKLLSFAGTFTVELTFAHINSGLVTKHQNLINKSEQNCFYYIFYNSLICCIQFSYICIISSIIYMLNG